MAERGRDESQAAFQELLNAWKKQERRPATREEQARQQAEQETVEAASAHTVERLVKDLADVQLQFGRAVEALTGTLAEETARLDTIRRAIEIEQRRLEALRHIRIAADALDRLLQEHEDATRAFEAQRTAERAALEQETTAKRTAWAQEQEAFERKVEDEETALAQSRQQAEDEYRYEQERRRRQEADAYEERRRALERSLQEQEVVQQADWAEREAALEARREAHAAHEQRLEAFEREKEEAVRQAREAALRQAQEDAETQAAVTEREVTARRNAYEAEIRLLETEVARQDERIAQLSTQLEAAVRQAQELAGRAMETRR